MRRGILLICVFLLLGAPVWGQEVAEKKRVAVMNFDFSGVQRWWESPNWDIGAGISDLIVKELVRDGSYTVVERRALDAVLAEQIFPTAIVLMLPPQLR